MNVTKCDCCGKIVGNDEAFKLEISTLKSKNNKAEKICRVEICDGCKCAVFNTLKIEEV